MPHAAPPASCALNAALSDLAANGVTDIISEAPFNWYEDTIPPLHSRPNHASTPSTPAPQNTPPTAKIAPQAKANPTPKEDPFNPTDALRTYGTPNAPLTLLTASLPHQTSGLPFEPEELILLSNILKAMNINIDHINLAAVTATQDSGLPLAPHHVTACHPLAAEKLAALAPQKILVLGQLSANVFIAPNNTPLTQLRKTQPQHANAPTVTTYHPRQILKTPILKQRVWQDIQKFVTTA